MITFSLAEVCFAPSPFYLFNLETWGEKAYTKVTNVDNIHSAGKEEKLCQQKIIK
jgi:hypothetical protein